jgi:hypothetical protein
MNTRGANISDLQDLHSISEYIKLKGKKIKRKMKEIEKRHREGRRQ